MMSYHSFGFSNSFSNIIVTDDISNNYRITVSFPVCNNMQNNLIDNVTQSLSELEKINVTNQKNIFTQKNTPTPPELNPIILI